MGRRLYSKKYHFALDLVPILQPETSKIQKSVAKRVIHVLGRDLPCTLTCQ